jgi:phosphoribosylanthranilate isomerase
LPVWKALPVAQARDVAAAADYRGAVDRILFDAKTPKGTLPGGMGLVFDWDLLRGWNAGGFAQGWGLAGGIHAANVGEALAHTRAPLVDCSSGVETAPGVKDADKIKAFCQAARAGSPARA